MSDQTRRESARAKVQEFIDLYLYIKKRQNFAGFDTEFISNVKLIDADPAGGVLWELLVAPSYGNMNGMMHGGAVSMVLDMGTGTALCTISKPGYWDVMAGVSRSLNVSYLRAIPVGATVRIRGTVVQHGRTMALVLGRVESVDGETVYATCEHHKVHVPTPEGYHRAKEEMDREKVKGKL